jgi:hypothetical protein
MIICTLLFSFLSLPFLFIPIHRPKPQSAITRPAIPIAIPMAPAVAIGTPAADVAEPLAAPALPLRVLELPVVVELDAFEVEFPVGVAEAPDAQDADVGIVTPTP